MIDLPEELDLEEHEPDGPQEWDRERALVRLMEVDEEEEETVLPAAKAEPSKLIDLDALIRKVQTRQNTPTRKREAQPASYTPTFVTEGYVALMHKWTCACGASRTSLEGLFARGVSRQSKSEQWKRIVASELTPVGPRQVRMRREAVDQCPNCVARTLGFDWKTVEELPYDFSPLGGQSAQTKASSPARAASHRAPAGDGGGDQAPHLQSNN